jgi:hypothetical protein
MLEYLEEFIARFGVVVEHRVVCCRVEFPDWWHCQITQKAFYVEIGESDLERG